MMTPRELKIVAVTLRNVIGVACVFDSVGWLLTGEHSAPLLLFVFLAVGPIGGLFWFAYWRKRSQALGGGAYKPGPKDRDLDFP